MLYDLMRMVHMLQDKIVIFFAIRDAQENLIMDMVEREKDRFIQAFLKSDIQTQTLAKGLTKL
jgi:hypothetical protein